MAAPTRLAEGLPFESTCRLCSMSPTFASPADMPAVLDVPVLHDARMPTHILVLFSANAQRVTEPPLLVPVDSDLYNHGFRSDLIPPASSHGLYVSVPAVHPLTTVSHPTSFPLLLLFALGLEPSPNDIAYQMLPTCNVLGLGVRDGRLVEMVRTAWNITAEARRLRTRS
ncbi:hypothetical protein BDZ89DRAFT_1092517 [Hymenopellis radicata]|nr:hypothetical protein BDZ89DRAFT_1092517 [Hymenopellis radicata]